MRLHRGILATLLSLMLLVPAARGSAASTARKGRIFVLMVWDGLRPDLVNQNDTPNLFALEHEGVRFSAHHAVFPSVTMANAATLATGYPPGETGIFGDSLYLPSLRMMLGSKLPPDPRYKDGKAINLEKTPNLITLNQADVLDGKLVQAAAIGQRVRLAHGYVAVAGKSGPTFVFDSHEFTAEARPNFHRDGSVLVVDDLALAPALFKRLGPPPPKETGVVFAARDKWYTDAFVDDLPAAVAASDRGHPALLVLWQRNPDSTQHRAGLGTEESLEALTRDDENLGRVRATVAALGVADRTDVMVVSDHGFVTQRDSLGVQNLLVSAGLKRSHESDDVIVVGDQGSVLIYLSDAAFPSLASRRARLQQIVDYVSAQDWSGPSFSGDPANPGVEQGEQGWIAGTFDYRALGLNDPGRSPDLIVSMREQANASNLALTGPDHPAFMVGTNGREPRSNRSQALVRPVAGVMDADGSGKSTTGMGVHGAAGQRELHNFCAAVGPDFRRHFVDTDPTGNTDVAPTIARVLGLRPVRSGRSSALEGRVMSEALTRGIRRHVRPIAMTLSQARELGSYEVETRLMFTRFDGHRYLDDSTVRREPRRLTKQIGEPLP